MKTYYCVTSKWDDRGNGWAGITSKVEAEEKPESTFNSTPRADVYTDWFDSYDEAEKYVRDVDKA